MSREKIEILSLPDLAKFGLFQGNLGSQFIGQKKSSTKLWISHGFVRIAEENINPASLARSTVQGNKVCSLRLARFFQFTSVIRIAKSIVTLEKSLQFGK